MPPTEWMLPHVEEFLRWRDRRASIPGDPPPAGLGRALETLKDVETWLSHPSNWFNGVIYIIRWNGAVPTISREEAWQLAPGSPCRKTMLEVILCEHHRRRRIGYREEPEKVDVGAEVRQPGDSLL